MAELTRVVVWVDGHVQGVGFRWWVERQAVRLGLAGSARNLRDGRVEVVAQGPPADVAALVGALTDQPGPSGRPGRVSSFLVERRPPDAALHGFEAW